MRLLTLGLIFSVVFSSLPVKVWACGLNLCPMDHALESKNDEEVMPCHQANVQETQGIDKNSKSTNEQIVNLNQLACPCPDTFVDATFIIESRKQIELEQNVLALNNTFGASNIQRVSNPVFRYRPPPLRDSTCLQILLQVFII